MDELSERETRWIETLANVLSRLEEVERKHDLDVQGIIDAAAIKATVLLKKDFFEEVGRAAVAKTPQTLARIFWATFVALLSAGIGYLFGGKHG
jgi:hypothetical protein